MTLGNRVFSRPYSTERPFVKIKIAILNPQTGQVNSFDQECWVDTGFNGGVHVPIFRRSEANVVNVTPQPTALTLAGGVRTPGFVCHAYLIQIEGHDLGSPGLETELIMQGNRDHGLIGLEILRKWIAAFNGPLQVLDFYES